MLLTAYGSNGASLSRVAQTKIQLRGFAQNNPYYTNDQRAVEWVSLTQRAEAARAPYGLCRAAAEKRRVILRQVIGN